MSFFSSGLEDAAMLELTHVGWRLFACNSTWFHAHDGRVWLILSLVALNAKKEKPSARPFPGFGFMGSGRGPLRSRFPRSLSRFAARRHDHDPQPVCTGALARALGGGGQSELSHLRNANARDGDGQPAGLRAYLGSSQQAERFWDIACEHVFGYLNWTCTWCIAVAATMPCMSALSCVTHETIYRAAEIFCTCSMRNTFPCRFLLCCCVTIRCCTVAGGAGAPGAAAAPAYRARMGER
eukprot:365630-Chlamydomonas_euryale.AAC.40